MYGGYQPKTMLLLHFFENIAREASTNADKRLQLKSEKSTKIDACILSVASTRLLRVMTHHEVYSRRKKELTEPEGRICFKN